jgi:hypothetical protein
MDDAAMLQGFGSCPNWPGEVVGWSIEPAESDNSCTWIAGGGVKCDTLTSANAPRHGVAAGRHRAVIDWSFHLRHFPCPASADAKNQRSNRLVLMPWENGAGTQLENGHLDARRLVKDEWRSMDQVTMARSSRSMLDSGRSGTHVSRQRYFDG